MANLGFADEAAPPRTASDPLAVPGAWGVSRAPAEATRDSLLADSIAIKKQEIASMKAVGLVVTSIGLETVILGGLMVPANGLGCDVENAGGDRSAQADACKKNGSSGFVLAMGGLIAAGGVMVLVMAGNESSALGEMEKRRLPQVSWVPRLEPFTRSGGVLARLEF